MVKLIPPVKFCSDENIQTIFGTKFEDSLNYRTEYNSVCRKSCENSYLYNKLQYEDFFRTRRENTSCAKKAKYCNELYTRLFTILPKFK
jgi:hypothetical protein